MGLRIREFEAMNGELASFFCEHRNKSVFYIPNPGKAGDSLIATATYELLQYYHVNYVIPSSPYQLDNALVLYGGGGNLVRFYSDAKKLLAALLKRNNTVVILPHTIRDNASLLHSLPPSCLIFCRDPQSYIHVLSNTSQCRVSLAHDLALFFDPKELLAKDSIRNEMTPRFARILKEAGIFIQDIDNKAVQCLRVDRERTIVPVGPNYDLAKMFALGVTPDLAERSAWMLLEFVRLAGRVITNRLHVGIAGAILGKEVSLYDNNYGKVSSVYEHSLRGRFPNVTFNRCGLAP
jgi:exopolysaccharide biosynthesis predicted pyruvyltransferase EpsI